MQVGGGVEIVRTSLRPAGDNYTMSPDEFDSLCSGVKRVDAISFTSLHALIVRVRFTTPGIFQLRNDITHVDVNELVFKCFIIQEGGEELDPNSHIPTHMITKALYAVTGFLSSDKTHDKKSLTNREADNEYNTQKSIYDKTKNMKNPICPNALGLFKFDMGEFNRYFASKSKSQFSSNSVFTYLGEQVSKAPGRRRIGILVMEAIPSNYYALAEYRRYPEYTTMCIHSSALFCISFALAGFILTDAHLENWMVTKTTKTADGTADVFALDVDKAINIDSLATLSEYAKKTRQLYIDDSELLPESLKTLGGFVKTIVETVRAVRDIQKSNAEWPIQLIHKLFVLGAISECLINLWGHEALFKIDTGILILVECKIGVILGKVYANEKGEDDVNFHKMSDILTIDLDLDKYLTGVAYDEISHIRSNLGMVSKYIAERTAPRTHTGSHGGSSATRKPIKPIIRRQYKTNRYRRGKKGKKSLKPKYLKRNRRSS